jgi:flagellin-like protein
MRGSRFTSVGLSPLVAVILLVAITVAAAVVVSGVFFNLAGIAGRRPTAVIDQIRLVATTDGKGTWGIVIKNTGDVPVTGISATFPDGCSPSITFKVGGNPVSSTNPLNPGGTASGSGTTGAGACNIGTTYPVRITVTFADGSNQILTTQQTAALA